MLFSCQTPFDGGVELVANGDAEVGMYLASEIQVAKGVRLVLPPELQSYVEYAGAVTTDSPSPRPRWSSLDSSPVQPSGTIGKRLASSQGPVSNNCSVTRFAAFVCLTRRWANLGLTLNRILMANRHVRSWPILLQKSDKRICDVYAN